MASSVNRGRGPHKEDSPRLHPTALSQLCALGRAVVGPRRVSTCARVGDSSRAYTRSCSGVQAPRGLERASGALGESFKRIRSPGVRCGSVRRVHRGGSEPLAQYSRRWASVRTDVLLLCGLRLQAFLSLPGEECERAPRRDEERHPRVVGVQCCSAYSVSCM